MLLDLYSPSNSRSRWLPVPAAGWRPRVHGHFSLLLAPHLDAYLGCHPSRQVPDGYLCRLQDGDLKEMVALYTCWPHTLTLTLAATLPAGSQRLPVPAAGRQPQVDGRFTHLLATHFEPPPWLPPLPAGSRRLPVPAAGRRPQVIGARRGVGAGVDGCGRVGWPQRIVPLPAMAHV
eukprot:364499-Chlamydomonas_euryale.AAC.6